MTRASAACAALLLAVAALADDAPLAKNPFVRPQLVELAAPESVASPPLLEVRAVLSAGGASLVDVGGRIVRLGEEVDGFRLVAVSEEGARFVKEGHSFDMPLQARAVPPAPAAAEAAVAEESGDAN
jgi:hypothetical protein